MFSRAIGTRRGESTSALVTLRLIRPSCAEVVGAFAGLPVADADDVVTTSGRAAGLRRESGVSIAASGASGTAWPPPEPLIRTLKPFCTSCAASAALISFILYSCKRLQQQMKRSGVAKSGLDSVAVGQHYTFAKTVGETDVMLFAGITGDFSDTHVNDQYMKEKSNLGERIAHGALMVGFMSTASTMSIAHVIHQEGLMIFRSRPVTTRCVSSSR